MDGYGIFNKLPDEDAKNPACWPLQYKDGGVYQYDISAIYTRDVYDEMGSVCQHAVPGSEPVWDNQRDIFPEYNWY